MIKVIWWREEVSCRVVEELGGERKIESRFEIRGMEDVSRSRVKKVGL
jgi:hypothetical protein